MSETRNYIAEPADLPRGTLVDLFLDTTAKYPDDAAYRHKVGEEWRAISHTEFAGMVHALATTLRAWGIGRGDRLAILSENRVEWAAADYATLCIGAYDVPVYPTLPGNQIHYLLENSGARAIFVSSQEQLDKIRSIRGELPALERVVVFDELELRDGEVSMRDALEQGRAEAGDFDAFAREARKAEPDDVATVLYTSGTTGAPKGVMLTHNNIYSNTRAVDGFLDVGPQDSALSLLPLSHIFERMVSYFFFSGGVSIAFAESIEKVPDNLVEIRPTLVASVPRLYEKIYARVQAAEGVRGKLVGWATRVGREWADAKLAGRQPPLGVRLQYVLADRLVFSKLRERTGGRLRFFISGGAPLSPEIGKFFYAAGVRILEGYGLTETSPVTNVNRPDRFEYGTVGPPVPGTEIAIAEDGEILVRGPQVMKGYYELPDPTAKAIDEEGWFHTGDIGEITEKGFLRITDRKKDLIVTAGGKNVAPQPIENTLKNNRFVLEAVIIGDRRPYTIVLVVPNLDAVQAWASQNGVAGGDGGILDDPRVQGKLHDEIMHVFDGLARYETPKKIGLLRREFTIEDGELTPSLKVKRRVVEKRYAELIERIYSSERDEDLHVVAREGAVPAAQP